MSHTVTCTHRLVLPADTNHHGTLYAGSLLRIALEAAYVTAHQAIGSGANLLLRRVLSLECYRPVPEGSMIEIRGTALHLTRAYLVVGLIGTPLAEADGPWMDALMGFVQVDDTGQPAPFPTELTAPPVAGDEWQELRERTEKLLRVR
jgi:acyl-CoA thioesterase YciA